MNFLRRIYRLQTVYTNELCEQREHAFLYGICNPTPPLAEHIVFSSLSAEGIQELINNYAGRIPDELLNLYTIINGAHLFWTTRLIGNNRKVPMSRLSIYGIPLTYDRMHLEPFNISIEDLNRPDDAPSNWLKFGHYYIPTSVNNRFDLFVDTDDSSVHSVAHGSAKCHIESSWSSIDECLCSIFDLLDS